MSMPGEAMRRGFPWVPVIIGAVVLIYAGGRFIGSSKK
jgi:hypothetical protein